MIVRLGRVLYWAGVALAAVCCLFGAYYGVVWLSETWRQVALTNAIGFFLVALAFFFGGKAARYILANE